MKEVILIKNGELSLKGLNRRSFEDMLTANLRRRLSPLSPFNFYRSQSTITAEPLDENVDFDAVVQRVGKVFGIAAFSRAAAVKKDFSVILDFAPRYLENSLKEASTFKVEAKRSDKKFPYNSPQICAALGERILNEFPHLKVDVRQPELTVTVEVRDRYAFIHENQIKGAGGLPAGSSGKAALLISGGIDSPVAGWMMAKRGLKLTGIHFASPPYTSPRAEQKVHALLGKVAEYSGNITLFTVPFTVIQEEIQDNCPESLFTIIMRRMMMRISSVIAAQEDCGALITGESVGQVASQTLQALACTDDAASLPVFRPLIGMDKDDVVSISRQIETFDISVLPYDDCCTVFTPKHPRIKPKLESVIRAESGLETDALLEEAVKGVKVDIIK